MTGTRCVSVIVPCRNEEAFVAGFVAGVLKQVLPTDWRLQLIVADGQSDDGTRVALAALGASEPRLVVIDNPGRIVSTGLNRALGVAEGEIVVRMDVHTDYAPDYIDRCIAALAATGADNAGGPWRAEAPAGAPALQRAVAAAFQSPLVAGGAASRRLGYSGWVDTVYLGAWPKATFDRFGGFDESLVRNQDDEHNLRITRGGGRIWQASEIRSVYRPRSAWGNVALQYLQYGYWKPFVIRRHRSAAAWRHLVPALFVLALAGSGVAAVAGAVRPLATLLAMYGAALAAMTIDVRRRAPLDVAALARVPLVIATYHLAYGVGSICGAFDAGTLGRGRARFGRLSR